MSPLVTKLFEVVLLHEDISIFGAQILQLSLQVIVSTKNGNGAQKNAHIFKSNAPTWLKLGVGFDHMYTKGWNFFAPAV